MMEPNRAELREELLAMLNAAPELPPEDRDSLADVFLDTLQTQYEVVPRGRPERAPHVNRLQRPPGFAGFNRPGARFGVLLLMMVTALWVTVMAVGTGHWHHPPVFLLPLLFVLALRFVRARTGGWQGYAPR